MITGKEFALSKKYDWNEEIIIVFGFQKCSVFLFVEEESGTPSFLQLTFNDVLCIKSARTDCNPGLGIEIEKVEVGISCILELFNTGWAEEAHKSYRYIGTPFTNKQHFLVAAHDVFHELLASSFTENVIGNQDKDYGFIKSLFPDYLF